MKISTKGRYGLKAMYDLALHHGKMPVPLAQISERQDISLSYLEQLFSQLKKAKLVKSIRGAHGGYILNREPNEITVGNVLEVLEGTLVPVACASDPNHEHCDKSGDCVTKSIWEKIHRSISDVVDSITLQDMVNDYHGLTTIKLSRGDIK